MVHGTPPPERFNFAQSIIERNAARRPKAAYIDDAGTLSYGDLENRMRSAAAACLAGHRRLSHCIPGRALRGHCARRRQYDADGR